MVSRVSTSTGFHTTGLGDATQPSGCRRCRGSNRKVVRALGAQAYDGVAPETDDPIRIGYRDSSDLMVADTTRLRRRSRFSAGAGKYLDVAGAHRLSAVGAAKLHVTDPAAGMVAVEDGRAGLASKPLVTPGDHHHEKVDEL